MKKAPVSVIIPCYCCASTIERAVASVFNQTVRPSEVILVDDASSDETYLVLKQIQSTYGSDWLRIIRLYINSGPSIARNAGWGIARQSYIAFLDADDSWHLEKIERQYGWMSSHPEVSLSGHGCQWLKYNEVAKPLPKTVKARKITNWLQLISNRFSTPSVMLKRDLPFRFAPEKRYSEDYLLWCEIILSGYLGYFLEAPMAYLYKAPYGESGLSGSLWKMQKGQIDSYSRLHSKGLLFYPSLFGLLIWSFIRFLRRIVLVTVISMLVLDIS